MLHTLSLPGFQGPGASTEVPLEMLAACHGRVQAQCSTLQRLVEHLALHGNDRQAREAAQAVMRYFDQAAPHHHEDEEIDLFPRLLDAVAGSDAVCIRELLDGLRAEHRHFEQRWQALRQALEAVANANAGSLDARQVQDFVAAYESHIEREETELIPMAQRLLDDRQLDEIGAAMRRRRGISPVD